MFSDARNRSTTPALLYANADIVMLADVLTAADYLLKSFEIPFVGVGMRRDVPANAVPSMRLLFDLVAKRRRTPLPLHATVSRRSKWLSVRWV